MSQFPNSPSFPGPMAPPPSPSGGNGGRTAIIIVSILAGVFCLVIVACGLSGYFIMRTASTAIKEIGEEVGKQVEVFRQNQADELVDSYRDHEKVQELIGEITSHEIRSTRIGRSGVVNSVYIVGSKASGYLQVEYAGKMTQTKDGISAGDESDHGAGGMVEEHGEHHADSEGHDDEVDSSQQSEAGRASRSDATPRDPADFSLQTNVILIVDDQRHLIDSRNDIEIFR